MTDEEVTDICNKLAEGNSLRAICREMGRSESGVRYWLKKNGDNYAQYARARELQADSYFDEILEIADDTTMSAEDRRIAIDARKWAAGKLHGKYSDKLTVTNNTTVTVKHDLDALSDDELASLESILAKSARGAGSEGEAVASAIH